MENRIVFCNTKRFEGDDAVRTELTLDFANVTEADLVDYAIDALVIKWQSGQRRKKADGAPVPMKATYMVPKPGSRAVATLTPYQMVEQLFGKEKALELVNQSGGNIDAVVAMLKGLIG
jgi:hypothetical protein